MQVGAVIVNDRQRVVGVGHNSMPYRCGNRLDWAWPMDTKDTKSVDDTVRMDTKYPYGMMAKFREIYQQLTKNR